MTSHNKPVSTIIEKANRTSCHRKNFIYANNRQNFNVFAYKIFPVTRESIAFAIEIEKEKLC